MRITQDLTNDNFFEIQPVNNILLPVISKISEKIKKIKQKQKEKQVKRRIARSVILNSMMDLNYGLTYLATNQEGQRIREQHKVIRRR